MILDDRVKELEEQVTLLQQKDEVQPQESEEVQQWREKGKELEEECKRFVKKRNSWNEL